MDYLQKDEPLKVKTGSSDGLSLRREATTKATTMDGKEKNIILSIPNGGKVTLESVEVKTGDKQTWYNVRYTDKDKKDVIGWVASDYLEDLRPLILPTLSWSALNANHAGHEVDQCDRTAFKNQCAIHMGVALEKSGVNLGSFQGARCYGNFKPPHIAGQHILRAQELADWLRKQTILVGKVKISKPVPMDAYRGKRGIVFFQNVTGLEGIDHIDIWDGTGSTPVLKNGCKIGNRYENWVTMCEQIWFWDLCLGTFKKDAVSEWVPAYRDANIQSPTRPSPINSVFPLEVVEIQENWVKVKLYRKGAYEVWFVPRDIVSFPDQPVAA